MGIFTRLRERYLLPKKHKLDHIPADISAHLARDIGLTQAELDRLRHQLPSQSRTRPLL